MLCKTPSRVLMAQDVDECHTFFMADGEEVSGWIVEPGPYTVKVQTADGIRFIHFMDVIKHDVSNW